MRVFTLTMLLVSLSANLRAEEACEDYSRQATIGSDARGPGNLLNLKRQITSHFSACNIEAPKLTAELEKSCPEEIANSDPNLLTGDAAITQKKAVAACVSALMENISYEKDIANDATQNVIDSELKTLEDMKTSYAELTETTLIERLRKEDAFAKIYTEDTWYADFRLGTKMMPQYNDNGENEGFSASNYIGTLKLDVRGDHSDNWQKYNFGTEVRFESQSIVNCEKATADTMANNTEDDSGDTTEMSSPNERFCQGSQVSVDQLSFNDVADNVDASAYAFYTLRQSGVKERVNWQLGARVGLQTREKQQDNGDSINNYQAVGVRYVYNEFKEKGNYKNGLPKFQLEWMYAKFEDYAGIDDTEERYIIVGQYRPTDDPIAIGLRVNAGKGPDELAITVTYGLKLDRLIGIF